MASFLERIRAVAPPESSSAVAQPHAMTVFQQKPRDLNAPDQRLLVNHQCIYERNLPGGAYITAHVDRLQSGYYDSPSIHEQALDYVCFVAVSFVLHPSHSLANRFKSAIISISVQNDPNLADPHMTLLHSRTNSSSFEKPKLSKGKNQMSPRFLRHAPHLIYGAISSATLQWNFNLAGSLGISQTPVSANLSPSGGVQGSYKINQMMRIQGSTRTLRSPYGRAFDVEDGKIVWSLEENLIQRSGLPREFTFVMLVQKSHRVNAVLDIEIQPQITSRFLGHYPDWWIGLSKYQPFHKFYLSLNGEVGQKFHPVDDPRGFNFANLAIEDFVTLPGATFSMKDPTPVETNPAAGPQDHAKEGVTAHSRAPQGRHTSPNQHHNGKHQRVHLSAPSENTIDVRVFIENNSSSFPLSFSHHPRTPDHSPPQQPRHRSLRRSRSRIGLNESVVKKNSFNEERIFEDLASSPSSRRSKRYSYPSYPSVGQGFRTV
ncbi:hypothetical protein M501DRAFT_991761 [Patellaria atrata CBS 101060]|uniref:Uncharacterized protein n=1 Tax=Patellaria atrata CBS 101060 TaxID=1346257 RepID=A0A9P4SBT5_9PEZI|nr:hypothetical protein M501DRAFT_991761 [Patellaria atrata CBS 101060]